MFWMRNKENSFPIRTLIWRPNLSSNLYLKTFSYLAWPFVKYIEDLVNMSAHVLLNLLNELGEVIK